MDYEKFKIKGYNNWTLFLHENQFPYIGRCYAWAKREDADDILDMFKHERDELFDIIIPEWSMSVKHLFNNDKVNVSFLGNTSFHLHCHLIPRFETLRNFYGIDFIDSNPKGNYAPYKKKEIALETLLRIRDAMNNSIF